MSGSYRHTVFTAAIAFGYSTSEYSVTVRYRSKLVQKVDTGSTERCEMLLVQLDAHILPGFHYFLIFPYLT